jgi:tRNA U34 2-thiouridine synthase MnmA/TrmU
MFCCGHLQVKFNEFIAKHLGEREGRLIEAETGELLGLHKGFWFYTIGQRHGLYLSNGPWYELLALSSKACLPIKYQVPLDFCFIC